MPRPIVNPASFASATDGRTPTDITNRVSQEIGKILEDKAVQDRLLNAGAIANYEDPAGMAKRIQGDLDTWGGVIRDKNLSAN